MNKPNNKAPPKKQEDEQQKQYTKCNEIMATIHQIENTSTKWAEEKEVGGEEEEE